MEDICLYIENFIQLNAIYTNKLNIPFLLRSMRMVFKILFFKTIKFEKILYSI